MRDRYASLREGLVGAWIPSVSGSGLLLPDLSGYGNNGTLTNMDASDWVSGKYGRALDFDGSDDSVRTKAISVGVSKLTVSAWINVRSSATASIAGLWEGGAGEVFSWVVNISRFAAYDIGLFTFVNGASFPNAFTSGNAFANSVWSNVVVAYDGTKAVNTDRVSIFVNGNKIPSLLFNQTSSGNFPTSLPATFIPLWIGAQQNTATRTVDGQLDDIRIYNRALSKPEIKLLSQEPGVGFKRTRSVFDFGRKPAYLPPTPADYRTVRVKQTEHASLREGLVGAWCPSIEGSGYTLPDLSGQGNNGTLTNMGPEDWVSGQHGRVLDFDGSDDYVMVADSEVLNLSTSATFSAWVYVRNHDTDSPVNQVLQKGSGTAGSRQYTLEFGGSSNNGRCAINIRKSDDSAWVTARNTIATPTSRWIHIAATYSAKGLLLYESANLVATNTTYTGAIQQGTGAAFSISSAFTNAGIDGQLDDIRIYNRALSEPEIKLLASRPGIGLRPQRRTMYYAPPTGARRRRILTSMP